MLRFYNTLSGKSDDFKPIRDGEVRMYHCGPTLYGRQHIGNLSMFVFTDVLRRTIEWQGQEVRQVINFTDFGHLSSDSDEGEDKMSRGLKAQGLSPTLSNMKKLAEKYAEIFLKDLSLLNIRTHGTLFPYASEYVSDQIELIVRLGNRGFTYITSDGVYFDTSKFSEYGKLGGLSDGDVQSRVLSNPEKKNARDFALWKFNSELGWSSPWGQGFPGWHIECSAMIIKLLGEQIDIHTGGIEHVSIHHNNEIAQSEAATGKVPFSRFWLHRAHLQLEGGKIAKSAGNVIYLSEITDKGYSPLVFRYFLLQSHYRSSATFSWEALDSAQNAYRRLKEHVASLKNHEVGVKNQEYFEQFQSAIEDDLNTPEALAVVWNLIKDDSVSGADKLSTLLNFDQVLGLDLVHNEFEVKDVPEDVLKLVEDREVARLSKEWHKSDALRESIRNLGFDVLDTEDGPKLKKL
jgi:cysteinyl-tRNA synthetase